MNWRFSLLLMAGLGLPIAAAAASPIYRCSGGPYVAYQNYPCPDGLQETLVIPANAPAVMELPTPRTVTPIPTPSGTGRDAQASSIERGMVSRENGRPTADASRDTGRPVFQQTVLRLGVTDDQVLNMPRWGLPDKITRTRLNGVPHEEWLYLWRQDGAKRLSFDNAKLTGIDDVSTPPNQQYATVGSRSVELRDIH